MGSSERDHLAILAEHFKSERASWPDLWHSLLFVEDQGATQGHADDLWREALADSPVVCDDIRLATVVRSHLRPGLSCHHYFTGDGFEAYSTLSRLAVNCLQPLIINSPVDRDLAPFHWLENVHWICNHLSRDNLAVEWTDEFNGYYMSVLSLDVFYASVFMCRLANAVQHPVGTMGKPERRILDALAEAGRALTGEELAHAANVELREFYRRKKKLIESGRIDHVRGVGYFRRDALPPDLKINP